MVYIYYLVYITSRHIFYIYVWYIHIRLYIDSLSLSLYIYNTLYNSRSVNSVNFSCPIFLEQNVLIPPYCIVLTLLQVSYIYGLQIFWISEILCSGNSRGKIALGTRLKPHIPKTSLKTAQKKKAFFVLQNLKNRYWYSAEWSVKKKHCVAKTLLADDFITIPTNSVTNSFLFFSFRFVKAKDKNQIFSRLVVSWPKIFAFFAYSELHSKGIPNSMDCYSGILLHVLLVCTIGSRL